MRRNEYGAGQVRARDGTGAEARAGEEPGRKTRDLEPAPEPAPEPEPAPDPEPGPEARARASDRGSEGRLSRGRPGPQTDRLHQQRPRMPRV